MLGADYSGTFISTFAALGNLGPIERERTMMFPFLRPSNAYGECCFTLRDYSAVAPLRLRGRCLAGQSL
jgi:hypothetical protein